MSVLLVFCLLAASPDATLPSGHPAIGQGKAPRSAAEVIAALDADPKLRDAKKPFAIAVSIGQMYLSAGRWPDAAKLFQEALDKRDAPPEDVPKTQLLLAHALFLSGRTAEATRVHDKRLLRNPDDAESLYARAAIGIEGGTPGEIARARIDLQRLLKKQPDAARAESARRLLAHLDNPAQPPKSAPPALSAETMAAFQNVERTPELQAQWAAAIAQGEAALTRGECQSALDQYKQVMPYLPEDGRVRAGMAWALVCLKKEPMASRVWDVAVGSDPGSLSRLASAMEKGGNAKDAAALRARLKQDGR
ncbi:MAG: tetratricopeptide repeat protein [Myxococcaceae bacterium]